MNDRSADVIIVGGGIVGSAAAAFLAEAGARVTLVDRDGLASGASGANSGLVQHPFDPVMAELYRESLRWYRGLAAADIGFVLGEAPDGLLYVSRDVATVVAIDADLGTVFPDLTHELLDEAALHAIEPALAPDLWACRVEIGYPVQPAASTYAYATLAEQHGAFIRVGRGAALAMVGDRVVGVDVDGERFTAGAVLVAAGPWTPEVIDPSGRWRPIRSRWGVVVETGLADGPRHVLEEAEISVAIGVSDAHPGADMTGAFSNDPDSSDHPDEERADFSLVPLGSTASIGSTFLARRPDPATWIEPILTRAARFVPSVADAPIRGTRACARPQTLDGRPLIGAVPWRPGLFICAGHGSWGISTGPASARLVVDAILGRDPDIAPALTPDRFGVP